MKRIYLLIAAILLLAVSLAVNVFSSSDQSPLKKIMKETVLPYFGGQGATIDKAGYDAARQHLKAIDDAAKFDAAERLSEKEQAANWKFIAVRDMQLKKYKEGHNFPPADDFYKSRSMIEADPVFKIIQQMPKGGLLHVHSSTLVGPDWIIARALATPDCYICWDEKVCTGKNGAPVFGQLEIFPKSPAKGFRKVADLAKSDPGFSGRLRSLLIIDKEEEKLPDIWVEFEKLFDRTGDFLFMEPVFKDYLHEGLAALVRDNVQLVELRGTGCFTDLDDLAKKCLREDREKLLTVMTDVYHDFQKDHPEFKIKVIVAGHRGAAGTECSSNRPGTLEDLKYWWREKSFMDGNHRFLVGYDLVGEEDVGCPTYDYLDTWIDLRNQGYDIPFFFHDGESNWPQDENLYDAYLLRSKRIGHGLNLFRFPAVMEGVIAADIPLEVSPISNQLLRYVRDLRLHPASEYLNRGVQIVISSDDPGLFGYTGLSYDFWEAAMAWRLDLRALKKLAANSITYSSLDDEEKKEAFLYWNAQWDKFIDHLNEMP